jgi:hypothetical protein
MRTILTNHQNIKTKLRQAPAIIIALLLANLFLLNNVSGQTVTLAHFGLNNNLNFDIDNAVGTPTASTFGLTYNNTAGEICEGTNYEYCNGSNDYLQININTTGFTSITITWQQRWSTVGTNRGRWNLSGDANNDGTYEYSKTDNADVTGSCATISVTLPASFNNQSAIRLRLTSVVTTGSYLLLDDVSIKGTVPCPTITASATKNDVSCFNTSTGIITITGSGGTSPYSFSIDNGSNFNGTSIPGASYVPINANSGKFINLPVNSYKIMVQDANGCKSKSVQ